MRSLRPFACRTYPISSSKTKSKVFKLVISETRMPVAYNSESISLLFFISQLAKSFLTSGFVKTEGIFFSLLGRFIEIVGSTLKIVP